MVWGMALRGFIENPILGWGQDNFNLVFNKYFNPGMYSQEPWFDRAHDVFFDWLIAGGLLGLLAYLSMFGVAIYTIWKKTDKLNFTLTDQAIFTGMFVAYFVQNIFVFDNLMSYTMFFTLLAYLHYGSKTTTVSVPTRKIVQASEDELFFVQFISSVVLIVLIFSIYFLNIKPIFTSKALIQALSTQDLKQGLVYFKKALSYKSFGSSELREQLVQRTASLRGSNIDNALKLEYFNLAKDEMQKQIDSAPDDARYRVFMTTLLSSYGLRDEALASAKKANELSPKKQSILFELIAAYINKGDYNEAFRLAKYAYDLEPNFSEAQRVYATIAVYAKKDDDPEIREIMVKLFGAKMIPDERFVGAYASTNRYNRVIEIWKKKLESNPDNPEFHLSLAASYLAAGQRVKSIEELKTVIKLSPSSKPTVDRYISEILAGRNP